MAGGDKPRLNEMQVKVRDILAQSQRPLSAYDLIEALRDAGKVAPPTVYRALQKLIDEGLAHRLETRNAYVACRGENAHCGHRHRAGFMICKSCGQTFEFDDAAMETLLAEAAARRGFKAEHVAIEIEGMCASCGGGGDLANAARA